PNTVPRSLHDALPIYHADHDGELRHVTTGVICEPIPHAAPVLYSRVSCRISPISGCGTSSSRFASAQFLVIWSATASSAAIPIRSEEHTSELQSRFDL